MSFAETIEEARAKIDAALPEMKEVNAEADIVVAVPLKELIALHTFREVALATEELQKELKSEKNYARLLSDRCIELEKRLTEAKGGVQSA